MKEKKTPQFIYGPVSSWRVGRSLGVDIISAPKKYCTFDCLYCQLGRNTACKARKKVFVPADDILEEIKNLPKMKIDHITFSGMGEPTLAANLKEAILKVKKLNLAPVAVLTNASLMHQKTVRRALSAADLVICKLDAYSGASLHAINKPASGIDFKKIVNGIEKFKKEFRGRLALQIMFFSKNRGAIKELKTLILKIKPDEVHINTPLRPSSVRALSKAEILNIKKALKTGAPVKLRSAYDGPRRKTTAMSAEDTVRRRGTV